MNTNYRILLYKEDDIWVAEAIDLPGCVCHGNTRQEAVAEMESLLPFFLEGKKNRPPVVEGPLRVSPPGDMAKVIAKHLGSKGGKAAGARKARTSEQARAAVMARWGKKRETQPIKAKARRSTKRLPALTFGSAKGGF